MVYHIGLFDELIFLSKNVLSFSVLFYLVWNKFYPADHDYCRFQVVLLANQIIDIGTKYVFKHQDLQMVDLKLSKYE